MPDTPALPTESRTTSEAARLLEGRVRALFRDVTLVQGLIARHGRELTKEERLQVARLDQWGNDLRAIEADIAALRTQVAQQQALVEEWRAAAQTHENYAQNRSDPQGDVARAHRRKADTLRKRADELAATLPTGGTEK